MAPSELSIEQIHKFLLEKGGIVPNRDVVRHFRRYLTDPATQDDARIKFKRYVNILATTRSEDNEKFLILRPKYSIPLDDPTQYSTTASPSPQLDPRNAIGIPVSPSISIPEFGSSPSGSPAPRQPPPYRPPPPVTPTSSLDSISVSSSSVSVNEQEGPVVPPRRRISMRKSESDSGIEEKLRVKGDDDVEEDVSENDKSSISVKERTQKFNRMASVDDELSPMRTQKEKEKKKKEQSEKGADEDDGAAVMLLDPKRRTEWCVTAAKGDYHLLVKLASEEPRFVKLKDPFTTVLHWGAKHGNEDIVKHFAGTYKCDVNAKTNGGYTPLHIAAQLGREKVYDLLIQTYGADVWIRDYSGKTPVQYKASHVQATTTVSQKKSRKKTTEKDLGFLRIGSLNVRVKKTTEAFSNFLGVGNTVPINPIDSSNFHKGWGSADNVAQENLLKSKRKMKRPLENAGTNSTPGTPNNHPRAVMHRNIQDSDSDSAAGFDSHWQN